MTVKVTSPFIFSRNPLAASPYAFRNHGAGKHGEKNLCTWYSPAYLPGCTSGLVALEYSFSSLEDH